MAQIQIPGVGSVEIPEFATEYTLNQLLAAISSQEASQIGKLGDIAQGINTEASILRSGLSEMQDTASNTGASRRSQDRANKNSLLTLQQMKKQHKDLVSASSKQASIIPRHTAQILRTAASMVGGKGIGDALSMMPGNLGQGIALATKVVGEFADSQRRLTDVGFGLGTSILTTTNAVAGFNVPLSEIERIAGTHAVTLDWLNEVSSNTVHEMEKWTKQGVKPGILAFAQLSHSVRTSMKEFGNFGFTVTEVDSYLAEYLESDRKRGITADVSTSNLTKNFKALAGEVSAYAADTGRNRKDLMKAQLENMNRTDASTYSMMLRMKGEDEAAETFESNLQLITNEMKSRYGDNADAMIDAWIVAQSQGRGLEATEQGAEFMAMLGPAGAVFDQMARSGEAIDPATFKLFDDKLKESVQAYDTQNYALLAKQKESLNMAANMIMYGRDTSEATRKLWQDDIKQKAAVHKAGETVLKANEAMVEITTNLQRGLVGVTEALVGNDGALSGELQKAIKSVEQFSDAIGIFARGGEDSGARALDKVREMFADNPLQFLFGAGMSVGGGGLLAAGAGLLGLSGLSGKDQTKLAKATAGENIKGHWDKSGTGIKIGDSTYAEGEKFKHQGTEYQVKDGKPQVTEAGIKSIKGGVKGAAYKGVRGSSAAGLFSLVSATMAGHEAYSAENERYKQLGGDEGATDKQKAEHKKLLEQIVTNALAKGGGGVLGGAAMGAAMGLMTTNPILMMLATGAGAYLGWEYGDKATTPDDPEFAAFTSKLQDQASASKTLSADEIKTRYVAQAKQKQADTDPSYIMLKKIKDGQDTAQATLDIIAGASASNAITAKNEATKNQGKPGANVSYVT